MTVLNRGGQRFVGQSDRFGNPLTTDGFVIPRDNPVPIFALRDKVEDILHKDAGPFEGQIAAAVLTPQPSTFTSRSRRRADA